MVNNWYDNLMEEEVPPRWMWPFSEELKGWFEEVKKNRESNRNPSSADEPEMTQNELAEGLR